MGTSGGVFGLERGYCLMIGGDDGVVARLDPIFATLAPGAGDVRPHARPPGDGGTAEHGLPALRPERRRPLREDGPQRDRVRADGRLRRGPEHPAPRERRRRTSTRSTPRRRRCATPSTTSTTSTCPRSPRSGGAAASSPRGCSTSPPRRCARVPALADFGGRVSDSGEGRWTVAAAIDEGVPAHVLTAALFERFASRGEADFANRVLSAMRMGSAATWSSSGPSARRRGTTRACRRGGR